MYLNGVLCIALSSGRVDLKTLFYKPSKLGNCICHWPFMGMCVLMELKILVYISHVFLSYIFSLTEYTQQIVKILKLPVIPTCLLNMRILY